MVHSALCRDRTAQYPSDARNLAFYLMVMYVKIKQLSIDVINVI